ncbi:MAG: ATP-binding protein [Bacteroidota bacterium]
MQGTCVRNTAWIEHKSYHLKAKKIVITGGPCVGKTSLIEALKAKGYACFPEVIREFTMEETEGQDREQLQSNPIVFAKDSLGFNQRLIDGRSQQYHEAEKLDVPFVFFDRGLPDVLAYMDYFNQPYGEDFTSVCEELSYDKVFILPPWKEIFALNEIRFESYEELESLHEYLNERYAAFGKTPVEVPKLPVDLRIEFILQQLEAAFE